jgi:NDP-sugar pyrophosphorylase family protein
VTGPEAAERDIGDVPVAILAGGRATRLGAVALAVPKAMVEVAGRPFIDHQLALLRRQGLRRAVLCLGHLGQQVEAHLGDGARHGMALSYSYDGETLLGTGGALRRAGPLLGALFFVMYGDAYLDIDYRAMLAAFHGRAELGLMAVLRNEGRWDRSNVVFRDGRLLRYDKDAPTPDMRHIDYGVALLRGAALDRIPPDKPSDLAALYRDLVAGGLMAGHEVERRFYEIGSAEGLEEARAHLAAREPD